MASSDNTIVALRGSALENTHYIHVAVTTPTGQVTHSVGNMSRQTLLRSVAKPVQALAVLSTGCMTHFGLDDADLALICSSHSAEDRHLTRARDMLAKCASQESDLRCGGDLSISATVNAAWIRAGLTPTAVHNNCSGKHAGFIAASKAIGADVRTYHTLEHPMQVRVDKAVKTLIAPQTCDIQWAIDGCNLPAPAMPLNFIAQTYAFFADAADGGAYARSKEEYFEDAARIFKAMYTCPELVAGEDRLCTELMRAFSGTVIGKVGADGCYGVGVSKEAPGARGRTLGIALKIEDGNMDVLNIAVVAVLRRLEIGSEAIWSRLDKLFPKQRINSAGVQAGEYAFPFEIETRQ